MKKLTLGRYDYAGYSAFIAYAACSLSIPLTLVEIGHSLSFPLESGGMGAGGVLHLVRSIAIVAALLLCGLLAARAGKRRSMGISALLMGSGLFLCACSPCYALLLPLLLVAGLGEGICEGVATPFVQDLHQDAPERYVNIAHSMWSVGIAITVVLTSGLLWLGVSWRIILGISGSLGIGSALLFLYKPSPFPESAEKSDFRGLMRKTREIFRCRRFWLYCLGMFLGAGAEYCLTFWAASYMRLCCNAGVFVACLGTGAIAAGMFLGRLGFGYYAKKQYLKHLLLACSITTIPLSLLLVLLTPGCFGCMEVFHTVLLCILFLCGIGIAPYWPTLQVYGAGELPELDTMLLYIYFSAMGIPGCGFFTWLMGVMGDRFGLRGAFLLIPGSLVFFALLVWLEGWIFPRRKK